MMLLVMSAYKHDEKLSVEELKTKLFKTSRPKSALIINEACEKNFFFLEKTSSDQRKKNIKPTDSFVKEFGEYIPLSKGRKISAGQLLERFLFDRKKQHDFVEKLSGGEQKRLYLCAVLIQNPNFLILDEPTNDLDVVTLNVLENFLLDYPGNLMVVSHDRYFMDKIVDNLFVFRGEGQIDNFPGNYSDFRAYEDSKVKEYRQAKEVKKEVVIPVKTAKKGVLSFDEKREWGLLEKDIERLQKKKETIETKFNRAEFSPEEINDKSVELQKISDDLEEKEERWFELSMKLEGE